MKKLAVAAVLVAIASLYFTWRHHHPSAINTPVAEDKVADGLGDSPARDVAVHNRVQGVHLSRELLGQSPEEKTQENFVLERDRDSAFERLLVMQGRDPIKEQQVLSRLLKLYSDRPEANVGEVACSSEFCRVDLRVEGKVDGRSFWAKDDAFREAVDPKGLTIFREGTVSNDNTTATCYFGRNDSWTLPDFQKLGIL
jgi:hypothetical protein